MRIIASRRLPTRQLRKFDIQYRGLDGVEATIGANNIVVVPRLHSMYAQESQLVCLYIRVRCKHSTVTKSTEILRGIEAKAADVSH